MKLTIENVGKIEKADVLIDGITIIAGENNAGKSTVGKALNASINALYGIDDFIKIKRNEGIREELQVFTKQLNLICKKQIEHDITKENELRRLENLYFNKITRLENKEEQCISELLVAFVNDYSSIYELNDLEEFESDETYLLVLKDVCNRIQRKLDIRDEEIGARRVTRVFESEFDGQIISLFPETEKARVCLSIKKKENVLEFKKGPNDFCSRMDRNVYIDCKSIFFDNPRKLEYLEAYMSLSSSKNVDYKTMLNMILTPGSEGVDIERNVLEEKDELQSIINEKNVAEVMSKIQSIMKGKFVFENRKLMFKDEQVNENITLRNMSTGLQSFAMLERALDSGIIQERSTVVLDEPEVNLHPEWQEKYAEMIVLLQEALELHVVISTHSPYFLKAIQYYSKKYNRQHVCHYYLAENWKGKAQIFQVDDNVQSIYKRLAMPMLRMSET